MATTLRDVAEGAGVSIRTAGRALRGVGPVSAEVMTRVRRVACELQYVPNVAARSLRKRWCRIVGVICGSVIYSESIQRRLSLLESVLRDHGYHVLLGGVPGSSESLVGLLREWSGLVDRVIFLQWPSSWSSDILDGLPQSFLFFDCHGEDGRHACILTDRSCGVEEAITSLIRLGRRRLAHVFSAAAIGRRSGVAKAALSCGVEVVGIETDGLELRHGYQSGSAIESCGAEGVFFDTDRMALGFYRYAHERGLRIPEEIAVVGFDNDRAGAYATPTLSTVSHPDEESVELAVSWVSGSADAAFCRVFPAHLIERESSLVLNPNHGE